MNFNRLFIPRLSYPISKIGETMSSQPPPYYPQLPHGFRPPEKRKSGLWWKILLIVLGSITLGIVGLLVLGLVLTGIGSSQPNTAASQSAAAQKKAESKKKLEDSADELASGIAKAIEKAAAEDRAAMEAQGWTYAADYLYYVTPDLNTYVCSTRQACVPMTVATTMLPDGCPKGISVNVSFFNNNDVSVYSSVRTTGRLDSGQQAALEFTDLSEQGSSFRVDSMKCY